MPAQNKSISGLHFASRLSLDTIIPIQSLRIQYVEINFIGTYYLAWILYIQTQYKRLKSTQGGRKYGIK